MKYRWKLRQVDHSLRRRIEDALGISPLLAHLLIQRQVTDEISAVRFLNPSLSHLYSPFLMKDMEKAVSIIRGAIKKRKKIVIFGDYDVDGITASALLYECLRNLDALVDVFIPNRLTEGYGLKDDSVKRCVKLFSPDLLITVDCGIRAEKTVDSLKASGVEVIITDHHIPSDTLPRASAILNPKRIDCNYPCDILAGVGVAYKLASALGSDEIFGLDLVALGTIADVCPIVEENRIFVKWGLNQLNERNRLGIRLLMELSSLRKATVRSIGFVLGPRLNASGRLSDAYDAFELLITQDENRARILAERLCDKNSKRQKVQEDILRMAEEMAYAQIEEGRRFLVLASESWHPGVVGIVAGRLADRFGMPCAVIGLDGDMGKGSVRSVDGISVVECLSACEDVLMEYGGHSFAGGFCIRKERIDEFAVKLSDIVKDKEVLRPVLELDGRLRLDMLNFSVVEEFSCLEPFGEGNPKPIFLFQAMKVCSPIKRFARDTVKFWVKDSKGKIQVVGFNMPDFDAKIDDVLDITASPVLNSYNGYVEMVLEMIDWRMRG